MAILEDALSEFELELNPSKTRVIELPQELDNPGIQELRGFASITLSNRHLISCIFHARIHAPRKISETTILRYAVSRPSPIAKLPTPICSSRSFFAVTRAGVCKPPLGSFCLANDSSRAEQANIHQTIHSMIENAHMNHSSEIACFYGAALVLTFESC